MKAVLVDGAGKIVGCLATGKSIDPDLYDGVTIVEISDEDYLTKPETWARVESGALVIQLGKVDPRLKGGEK